MFPTLYASLSNLTPEVYFGGASVPPYYRRQCAPEIAPEEVVRQVRLLMAGSNCSGYVSNDGIYLHMFDEEEEIQCDLSREFVIIAEPHAEAPMVPSSWQLMRFLQEPARRAIWITRQIAVYVEKSAQTMALCEKLDRLWQEDAFFPLVQEAVMNAEAHDLLLPALMRRYEQRATGDSTAMWQFYDTFGPILGRERLFLSMRTIP
jgi:hypothetical protein